MQYSRKNNFLKQTDFNIIPNKFLITMIIDIKGHGNKFEYSENTTRLYNRIRHNDVLTKEEERQLFFIIKNGTKSEQEKAKKRLVDCNLKLAVSAARAYAKNSNLEDLISESCLGLLDAIEHFNLEKAIDSDVRFSTYAIEYMRRNIDRYRINYDNIVRQTNRVKTIHHIAKARNSFIQKFEREPSSNELLDWLNENYLDKKLRIDDPNDVIEMQCSSIDEPIETGDDDFGNVGLMQNFNVATKQENNYLDEESSDHNKYVLDTVLSCLSERDRNILKMYFGIGCPAPVSVFEIAYQTSLTPERIRQIKADAIKKLKEKYGNLPIGKLSQL